MIGPAHVQLMARYNRWQNRSLYTAAGTLSEAQRREERGAFFGSIHKTLTHLLWADQAWMGRFTGIAPPRFDYGGQPWPRSPKESVGLAIEWAELNCQRAAFDETILNWSRTVSPDWLAAEFRWTNSSGRTNVQPTWALVTHMFNHQTHHRGQVHALLTAFGAKPEDTDIPWMPPEE